MRFSCLMLTTALVTLAVVPAARAQLEVTIGGYTDFQAAAYENDAAGGAERDFLSESEIHINFRMVADNGLEFGGRIELQTSTSDDTNSDETNVWMQGNWGRLELGDQDGAGSELVVMSPYVGIGQTRGSFSDYVPAADRGYRSSESGNDTFLKATDTQDATKITYYTPRFFGFRMGASFAPERDDSADGEQVQFSSTAGDHEDAFEIGAHYEREVGEFAFELGGQYTGAASKDGSTLEEISAWALGAQAAYRGFTFGGGYKHDGDSGQTTGTADDNVTGWNLGLTYEKGPWGVGLSYAELDFDDAAVPFEVTGATGAGGTFTAYGVGGAYTLAPGLSLGADLIFFDRNRVTGADTDGYVLVTEVKAAY